MQLSIANGRLNQVGIPFFDGYDLDSASYTCNCSKCNHSMSINGTAVYESACKWKETFSQSEIAAICSFFKISETDMKKFFGPTISAIICKKCNTAHLLHTSFEEYRHSTYRITALGLSVIEKAVTTNPS